MKLVDNGIWERMQCLSKYNIIVNAALYYNIRTKFLGHNIPLLCVPLHIHQYPVFQSNITKSYNGPPHIIP